MERPASIIIRFNKSEALWAAFVNKVEPKLTDTGADGLVTAALVVTDYDLNDHQFIRLRLNYGGKEGIVQIPRDLVSMIIEGKALEREALGIITGE